MAGYRRVVVACPGLRGHINASFPLAEELVARGLEVHCVVMQPGAGVVEMLEAAGCSVTALSASNKDYVPGQSLTTMAERVARFVRMEQVDMVDAIVTATRRFQPDVMIADSCWSDAFVAARKLGIPCASLHAALGAVVPWHVRCERLFAQDAVAVIRARRFHAHGVPPVTFRRLEAISDHLNILPTTAVLVEGDDVPPNSVLVGPMVPRGNRDATVPAIDWAVFDPSRPIVYISFGTLYFDRLDILETLLRAASDLEVNILLSSALGPAAFADVPKTRFVCKSFVPQLEALQRCDLFVSHGGHSSFAEAIASEVPLLIIPLASDQPVQGYFASHFDFGGCIAPEELSVERAAAEMRRLLQRGRAFPPRARQFFDSYHDAGGARAAADALLVMAG